MRKSWGLTKKILSGEKTVETRWYKNKYKPWGQIGEGDVIYFKDSGEPVTLKAIASGVEQYSNLDETERRRILSKYTQEDLGTGEIMPEISEYIKNKPYCLVVHLKNPQRIEPFDIDKSGYGAMASWLVVDDIEKIKLK